MQRAGQTRSVSFGATRLAAAKHDLVVVQLTDEVVSLKIADPTAGCEVDERRSGPSPSELEGLIHQRIQTRLLGRVRNLRVRVETDSVLLEGECSTFYTKQLAQHAAMGVLEHEHLENAIVVQTG
ncbi:MAG: hypothetical protein IT425_08970 [Pirellulales bacterium]|nr:hypothetical protein [Pirellulales bacterium]